jgi:hemerythrin-like domain-containing protein
MPYVTQPLRDEHRELLPELEVLREAADGIDLPSAEDRIAQALQFLNAHLIPHAQAEDAALYPIVGRAMGAARATATMSRDHVEVGRLTQELAELLARWRSTTEERVQGRRLLYGLYALIKVHFAKEEEIYLPLLDEALPPDEAAKMFAAMEAAAATAKAAVAAKPSAS